MTTGAQLSPAHTSPDHAGGFFIQPADGAVVSTPLRVKIVIENFGIDGDGAYEPHAPAPISEKIRHGS
jgi:hypothetical protein